MKNFSRLFSCLILFVSIFGGSVMLLGQDGPSQTLGVNLDSAYDATDTQTIVYPGSEVDNPAGVTIGPAMGLPGDPVIPIDYSEVFTTFAALVGAIPLVVEAIKKLINKTRSTPNIMIQILSWVTGVALALIGWYFDLGFLAEIEWGMALLYGLGASLAANGVADTKIIQWIFSLLAKKN